MTTLTKMASSDASKRPPLRQHISDIIISLATFTRHYVLLLQQLTLTSLTAASRCTTTDSPVSQWLAVTGSRSRSHHSVSSSSSRDSEAGTVHNSHARARRPATSSQDNRTERTNVPYGGCLLQQSRPNNPNLLNYWLTDAGIIRQENVRKNRARTERQL